MTITTNPVRNSYVSGAGQTIFNYTFKIFLSSDLDVTVNDVLTTSYVVDPNTIGDPSGGFITFNSPLSSGDEVVIVSGIPFNRTTDYQNNGDFRPEVVNADFDRVVSLVKQVEDDASENLELINELDSNNLKRSGGQNTMAQPIIMGGQRIHSVGAPVAPDDAVNDQTAKEYDAVVEAHVAEVEDNSLQRKGGQNAMLQELSMSSNRITDLGAPTGPDDAVRLQDVPTLNGDSIVVSTKEEEKTLIDGQLVVNFTELTTAGGAIYVAGDDIDRGRLDNPTDYSVTSATSITLTESFPAGSIIRLVQNEGTAETGNNRRVRDFSNLADAVANVGLKEGESCNLQERTTGNGGGAMWDVVLASSVTPNGDNIVQCTGVPTLALVKRVVIDFGSAVSVVDKINTMCRTESAKVWCKYVDPLLTIAVLGDNVSQLKTDRFVTQYQLKADADGMFDMNAILVGTTLGAIADTQDWAFTGSWTISGNSYATVIGDSAKLTATDCTEISVANYADNRGGLFDYYVYDSTQNIVAKGSYTTFATVANTKRETLIASGLVRGDYEVAIIFKGGDPVNPPSGSARGWALQLNGVVTEDSTGAANFNGDQVTIMSSSVVTFAILAKPDGSGSSSSWCPAHSGQTGVAIVSGTKVLVKDINDTMFGDTVSAIPPNFIEIDFLNIIQSYDAWNNTDKSSSMWAGQINHTFNKSGWSLDHRIAFKIDTFVSSGYMAMLANKTNILDRFKATSSGNEVGNVYSLAAGGVDRYFPSENNGVFYGELSAGRPIVYGQHIKDLSGSDNNNKSYKADFSTATLLNDRVDNLSKRYHLACDSGTTIKAGDTWSVSFDVVAGVTSFPVGVSDSGVGTI